MSRHDWKYNADSSCHVICASKSNHINEIRFFGDFLYNIFFDCYFILFNIFFSFSIIKVLYQKRLKKERRARRKLADQLELETKRRCQFEEALKTTSSETFLVISGKSIFIISLKKWNSPDFSVIWQFL
jgi:hypothetical protein